MTRYTPLTCESLKAVRLLLVVVLGFLGLQQAQASALTLGQAAGYDVFTLGNFTETGTDSTGRVAVGGYFAPSGGGGFSIATSLSDPAGVYDLVVGGNYTNGNNSVGGGDIFVGGNMAWSDPTTPHNIYVNGSVTNPSGGGSVGGAIYAAGTCSEPSYITCNAHQTATASPIDFAGAQTNLDNVSSTLATQTVNGTTSFDGYSTYTLTGTNATVNVFTLNGSTFSGDTININAPAGSTVIVNVSGTSDSFTGGSINMNGVSESNVIFNFSQANSVSIANMSFNATLLAPLANFNGGGGQLNGQLIVNNAAGTTEFHNVLFSGTLPGGGVSATPEPSTWLMVLGGIGAVVFSNRRRLSASRA